MKSFYTAAIALLVASCASAPSSAELAPTSSSFIEIRFAGDDANGASAFAFRDSTVYLEAPVISDADITAVATQTREGGLQMMLYPTPEADVRLYQATNSRIGDSLALVVGGEARSVVRLQSSLGGGGMLGVGFAATDSVAQRLATEIAARWPEPETGH